MATLDRYWQTVRYLKPIQIYGRLWSHWIRPRIDSRPAPSRRQLSDRWERPAARRPSMLGPSRFIFLNHAAEAGWDDPSQDRLWLYNLHYFDDLNAAEAGQRREWHAPLIERWIRENPPGVGTGWEPYPTSLRLVNWIKWILGGAAPAPAMLDSLAVQARWLNRRIERYLLGNHLLANAKALVFAGLFFEGPEAEGWLEAGCRILAGELPEQILADGGQFERSPMYHALTLEDLLDLWNLTRACEAGVPSRWAGLRAGWPEIIAGMRRWLRAMEHPDGEISFFNDAAIGVAPPPAELDRYAGRLGLPEVPPDSGPVLWLKQSGYIRVTQPEVIGILDAAPLGPDYLPGHGHADTLSFELSLFGRRVLVNSGTSLYNAGPQRQRERGTAAHNTVNIDGADSSEVWSAFRVARRARPIGPEIRASDPPEIRCAHDGYERLPGQPRPSRTWRFEPGQLRVVDEIAGRFTRAECRYHLHPDVRVRVLDHRRARLEVLPGRTVSVEVAGGPLRSEATTWHPEFGQTIPTTCLTIAFTGATISTVFRWELGG